MFEREAGEYIVEHHCKNCWMKDADADGDSKCTGLDFCGRNKDWQRDAEFGYNKAKEKLQKRNGELAGAVANLNRWLEEAKSIIKELLDKTYGEGWNYSLDVKVRAEQFCEESKKW